MVLLWAIGLAVPFGQKLKLPSISQLQDDFFTLRGPKGYDSFVFSATGVFREFFTKPLMIDLTVGGSEKAGQIIVQAGKTLLTPCCSFLLRGVEKRSRPVLRFRSRRIRLLPQALPAEIERALCRGSCWHKT